MLNAGTKLGRYEIQSQLGSGGMGEVWEARDARLNREVAIKILPPSFANDEDRLCRFEQEAKAISALNLHSITSQSPETEPSIWKKLNPVEMERSF